MFVMRFQYVSAFTLLCAISFSNAFAEEVDLSKSILNPPSENASATPTLPADASSATPPLPSDASSTKSTTEDVNMSGASGKNSMGMFILGARDVSWSTPEDSIALDSSQMRTAEFSMKFRNNFFVNAYLGQSSDKVANSTDNSSRVGVQLGLGNLMILTESGKITGAVKTSVYNGNTSGIGVFYSDVGPVSGDYSKIGLFVNMDDKTQYGLIYLEKIKPQLWGVAPTGYKYPFYFTDRAAVSKMTLIAVRYDSFQWMIDRLMNKESFEAFSSFYLSNYMGIGLGSITPSQSAVDGANNAFRVPEKIKALPKEGVAVGGDWEIGWSWFAGKRNYLIGAAAGLFLRVEGADGFNTADPNNVGLYSLAFKDSGKSYDTGTFFKLIAVF